VRVGQGGSFAFDLPSVPDPGGRGEVYFASVEYLGILYFGRAIHQAVQLDSPYVITVHDTAVAPATGARLPLEVRYLILEPLDEGWQVTDLLQVRNDGDLTLVAAEGGAVLTYPLPSNARDFQMGAGDVDPDAVTFAGGRLRVTAPIPPGQRQYVVRYVLDEPRLELSLPGRTHAVELLVPEPAPPLEVEGLGAMQPVEMEAGVTYRRYAATELADATVRVVPGEGARAFSLGWIAVLLALVLAGGALWALRARPGDGPLVAGGAAAPALQGSETRARLLLEIASLDERLDAEALDLSERGRLEQRRVELLERLGALG